MGNKFKIAVFVSGGGTNLQAIIDRIADGTIRDTRISVVISNKAEAKALDRAKAAGIPAICLSPRDYADRTAFAEGILKVLGEYGIDLVVLAGYLVIMPEQVTAAYKERMINIHPSLIPAHCGMGYYGIKVHESVLAAGNKVTGATVHFVDEEADHGPIILQKAVEVLEGDTPQSLQKRVMEEAEWLLLPKAIDLLAHGKVKVTAGIAHID